MTSGRRSVSPDSSTAPRQERRRTAPGTTETMPGREDENTPRRAAAYGADSTGRLAAYSSGNSARHAARMPTATRAEQRGDPRVQDRLDPRVHHDRTAAQHHRYRLLSSAANWAAAAKVRLLKLLRFFFK